MKNALTIILTSLIVTSNCFCEDAPISSNQGWDPTIFDRKEEQEEGSLSRVLWWLPNRVLDLIDIFHVDVGAGPTLGGVIRVTKYGQAGIRIISPLSLRVGLFGRRVPVLLESSSEIGIGPAFKQSKDRKICSGEVGLSLDAFLGVSAGICFDEVADFIVGLAGFDLKNDDIS
ncbi:MAG: hypothetical protein SGJ02_01720 [bacterium]|nr:hypothetical protein [bacterium]